jgi:hypothetical protein
MNVIVIRTLVLLDKLKSTASVCNKKEPSMRLCAYKVSFLANDFSLMRVA